MRTIKLFMVTAAAFVVAACSGGSDDTLVGGGPTGPGGQPPVEVASLSLLTSTPSIRSDGTTQATITALVRDANNNVMSDVGVVFSADSGSLAVTQPAVTDANGVVTALLSPGGDPTVRTINISGIAGGDAQSAVAVRVTGVTITIDGPSNLSTGAQGGPYTVRVSDDPVSGKNIPNAAVTVTSSAGNAVTLASPTTNADGELQFTLAANTAGTDTLTATALGASSIPKNVTISGDAFSFTSPDPAQPPAEVALGSALSISVLWQQNGQGVPNRPVTFASSRGTVSQSVVNTANGVASITVSSDNAGPAVITATNDDGASIQLNVEFVATTPSVLELQAQPFTITTEGQSTITAIVRDANGNLVKNRVVAFVLTDVTGGSLSVAQATTNSVGRAQTVYRASTATSANNGVRIDATVQGLPAVTDNVNLTVAQRELFISIGTGNEIDEPNTAQYRKEWIVQVTDAQGAGVPNTPVTFSVHSTRYWDGHREFPPGGSGWSTVVGPVGGCMDEDIRTGNPAYDRNGVLDPGEDNNGNGEIEAGNIASAVPQGGSGASLTTDGNGFGIIDLYWPQEYAYYLEVVLQARTSVQGTEFSATTTFMLDGSAADFQNEDVAPPGVVSPFGVDFDCATPPPQ